MILKKNIISFHLTVILAISIITSADPIPNKNSTSTAEPIEPTEITTTESFITESLTTTTTSKPTTSKPSSTSTTQSPKTRIINVSDAPVTIKVALPEEVEKLPKSFDGRTAWTECPSLKHVSDQGSCGGCWAVVTTDVAADRLCIASNGV